MVVAARAPACVMPGWSALRAAQFLTLRPLLPHPLLLRIIFEEHLDIRLVVDSERRCAGVYIGVEVPRV